MFDPYSQWLDIAKEQRPITYYLLLGISPKERDEEAIEEAAEAQSAKVREYERGAYAQACDRILKEIEQAKNVLLSPAKRREYDALLRKRATTKAEAADEVVVAELDDEAEGEDRPGERSTRPGDRKRGKQREGKRRQEQKSSAGLLIVIGAIAAVLVLAGGAVGGYLLFFNKKEPERTPVAEKTQTQIDLAAKNESPTPPDSPSKSTSTTPLPAPGTNITPVTPTAPMPNPSNPSTTIPYPTGQTPPTAPADTAKPPEPKPPSPPIPKPWQPRRPANVAKIPVPGDAALAKAEQALKETYKADYAKTKPDEQIALAAKLLQPGRENRDDPAAWFVLLREARDLGIQTKRPRLALEAIDEMDHYFKIDPIDIRLKAITAICKGANDVEAAGAFRAVLNLIQISYSEENFDAPKKYLDIVEEALRNAKADRNILRVAQDQRAEIDRYTKEFQEVTQARAKLAKS